MVLLTGATGFVGGHMLRHLLAAGYKVRCLVRPSPKVDKLRQAGVEIRDGDILNRKSLEGALPGIEQVIHLVGIILERGPATFARIHHEGTRNLVSAAQQAGVKRYLQMSALGARDAPQATPYHRTKGLAEQEVIRSGLPYVIFRPAIIFGPHDGFVTQMVGLLRPWYIPIIPIVGTGRYPLQPIFIDNVCQAFVQALTNDKATNKIFDLGGPEVLTSEKVMDLIAAALGVKKPKLRQPLWFMRLNAALMETLLPLVGLTPPVTCDQLQMLEEGSGCDMRPALDTFDLKLVRFADGLKTYVTPAR